jgi:hypothetical protein
MFTPSLRPRAARVDEAVPCGPALSATLRGRRLGTHYRAEEARRPAPWAETQGRGVVQLSRREGGELSTPPSRLLSTTMLVPLKEDWYRSNTTDLHPTSLTTPKIGRPAPETEGVIPQLPPSPVRAPSPEHALSRHAVPLGSASHRGSLPRLGAPGLPSRRSPRMASSVVLSRTREIPRHRQPCRDTPPRSVRSRLGPLSESSQENRP